MHPLDGDAMRAAAALLVGEHDFSSFRASACQAQSPVKDLRRIEITRIGEGERCRWHFEFEADAFLHHMIRNIMGCLVRIGQGDERPEWIARGAGTRAAAWSRRRPSRRTACTSSARCTTPSGVCRPRRRCRPAAAAYDGPP